MRDLPFGADRRHLAQRPKTPPGSSVWRRPLAVRVGLGLLAPAPRGWTACFSACEARCWERGCISMDWEISIHKKGYSTDPVYGLDGPWKHYAKGEKPKTKTLV